MESDFEETVPTITGSDTSVEGSSFKVSPHTSVTSKGDSKIVSREILKKIEDDCEIDYEISEEQEECPISLEHDMLSAKAFLQKYNQKEGISLYDHLSDLLNKVLSERPENVIEFFEEYSRKMKEDRFRPATDYLQDIFIPPDYLSHSMKLMPLFQPIANSDDVVEVEDEEREEGNTRPDIMELLFYFEQAGVGLPRAEMFCIALALRNLAQSQPIRKYRFWGKILGLEKNYIVAETDLQIEEYERRNTQAEEAEDKAEEEDIKPEAEAEVPQEDDVVAVGEEEVEGEGEEGEERVKIEPLKKPPKFPPVPQSMYKKPPEPPVEISGQGINKKVYYVCHNPGDEWVMLPDVTPAEIVASRKIKRYFTGNLDTEFFTFPPFPGKEINYLRAQIARISAGTQISPLGFFHFDEEEEEVEEEEVRTDFIENPEYEPVPLRDLVDDSMSFWVHHALHILKQGRTVWWNPKGKVGEEEEEEEQEPEDEEEGATPEIGPPLLTPLSEDATIETVPPWTVRTSSQLFPDSALAVIRSNLWPGAYAFAVGKKFENVYFGWGHKFVTYNYSPPPVEPVQNEYSLGPEIMEINDATVEEEEAWRLAHEKPPRPEGQEEGEEEGEEEVEDEEDEED